MSVESDQQYFSRRYEEESAAADRAANREAQIAHLELAARYAQLAAAIREVDERIGASFVPSVSPRSATTEHLARVIGT
jgi:SLT domain-containing protein